MKTNAKISIIDECDRAIKSRISQSKKPKRIVKTPLPKDRQDAYQQLFKKQPSNFENDLMAVLSVMGNLSGDPMDNRPLINTKKVVNDDGSYLITIEVC